MIFGDYKVYMSLDVIFRLVAHYMLIMIKQLKTMLPIIKLLNEKSKYQAINLVKDSGLIKSGNIGNIIEKK